MCINIKIIDYELTVKTINSQSTTVKQSICIHATRTHHKKLIITTHATNYLAALQLEFHSQFYETERKYLLEASLLEWQNRTIRPYSYFSHFIILIPGQSLRESRRRRATKKKLKRISHDRQHVSILTYVPPEHNFTNVVYLYFSWIVIVCTSIQRTLL